MICINKPETIFVIFGSIFGLLILFITPPFQVPDETSHFYRALQISQGELIAQVQGKIAGGDIPKNAVTTGQELAGYLAFHPEIKQSFNKLTDFINLPPQPKDKTFMKNHSTYPFIPYLPQVVAVSIGKWLHFSWLKIMYLGRIFNLITWLICVYLAIRIIPISKWLLVLLALSPMSLFQAASLSADSLTNGLSFLFVAALLKLSLEEENNIFRLTISVSILAILVSLCKPNYISLILLLLLVPSYKLGVKKYSLFLSLTLLSSVSLITIWFYLIQDVLTAFQFWRPLPPDKIVFSSEQLKFILGDPMQYLMIIIHTIRSDGLFVLEGFIGRLGWLDTALPTWLLVSQGLMLLFYALTDSRTEMTLSPTQKTILFLTAFGSTIFIFTSLYLSWTPVGELVIEGLQGRYFIPIGILWFLLLYNNRFPLKSEKLLIITACYVPLVLTTVLVVLIDRYYVSLI